MRLYILQIPVFVIALCVCVDATSEKQQHIQRMMGLFMAAVRT